MKIKPFKLALSFLLLFFSGCGSLSLHPIHRMGALQDSLSAIIQQPSVSQYPEAGAIYLLDKATRIIHSDGSSELIIHQIIKICRERGRRFAEVQIPYNEAFQRVRIDFAHTITREGKKIEVKKSAIHTITPASLAPYAALYSSLRTKTISMPAVGLGSTIEYKYRIFQKKSLMKNHFWDGFYFQSEEPFVLSKYVLALPEERRFKKAEKGIAPPKVTEKGNRRVYIWEKRDIPGLIPEPQMPPLSEVVPLLSVSSVKDWEEVASWYWDLAKSRTRPDKAIRREVHRLIEGKKTSREKLRAIYNYCSSNIRYVGLEIGINGYQPHEAAKVFWLKYGDCKDKAALLVAMLQVAGIKSYLVLINTDHQIDIDLPSPGQFNHCIVAVPIQEKRSPKSTLTNTSLKLPGKGFLEYIGKYIFLDTTAEVCSFGDLPIGDQNRDVLIIKEKGAELAKTPLYRPEDNCCQRRIEVDLKENGAIFARAKVTTCGFYNLAYRASFRYLRPVERRKRLAEDLNRICPGANLREFEISDLTDLDKPVEEHYTFFAKNYAIKIGDKVLIKPALIEAMRSTALVSAEKRSYPILFQRKWERVEDVSINLPAGWKVETLPKSLSLRYPFGEFDVIYKDLGDKIIYRRRFRITQPEISIVDYSEFKQFYETIAYQDRKGIILVNPATN